MTRAGLLAPEDLERIANQAQANRWPVAVLDVADTRIVTAGGTLVWSPVAGYWHLAYIATGYTRDDKGREVPLAPCTNLNGRPLTRAEAGLIALHETARSGCTRIYLAALAGGGA